MKKALFCLLALSSFSSFAATNITQQFDSATGDVSYLIKTPTHSGSALPLSYNSDMNGVCRYFGYDKAAKGSQSTTHSNFGNALEVDKNGVVVSGYPDFRLEKIVCLNKNNTGPTEQSYILNHPKHPASQAAFAFNSSENGVCKNLGYDRAAKGTRKGNNSNFGDVLKVDNNGDVEHGWKDFRLEQIVCLGH